MITKYMPISFYANAGAGLLNNMRMWIYEDVTNNELNLKSGETLHVEPADWKRKRSPSKLCRYIEKKYTIKFE